MTTASQPEGEKLQKILAARGLGSRREIENWISEGRVSVNGQIAALGDRALNADRIEVDKKPVDTGPQHHRIILYNKAPGEVSTRRDEKSRPTVFDRLPRLSGRRWINVGRLDINTTGLMLFTTDGTLANKLMHPSSNIDREYRVRVYGEVTSEKIDNMLSGVELDGVPARFSDIVQDERESGKNRWYTVCLMEGRNREVRRLWESQDIRVNRLKRVRYGPIFLPGFLGVGQWLDLDRVQARELYRSCDIKPPMLGQTYPAERSELRRQEQNIRSRGYLRRAGKA